MEVSDSQTENLHITEKRAKERKEKKKKKSKVADASVHAETQPEMVKGGRTKKEVVDSGSLVEPEPAPSNLEGKEKKKKRKRDREDEGPPSSDKNEKKKRKKEKTSGTASDPTSAAPLEAADISGVTTLATSEVKEMKKRRKAKSSAETFNPPTSDIEPTPIAGAVDGARKPRKRKTAKDDTTDANGGGEPLSHSKPKSKKRKKGEDEDHPSTVTPTEDSPQKRKKSKTSIHPDPSNDSDLTEQSRKALIHVHSQSTSPETWKFNKARQNWIIRNIWTSKVPEKYVPMVVDYLSKIQGRVRDALIESCHKVISGTKPDPPATQAETDEKGSSENPSSAAPDPLGRERIQRAQTLLYALAGKS